MAQATVDNNTRRRDFLLLTAAVATVAMAARPALASPAVRDRTPDDSALLAMEEQYFEQYELAAAHDDEIIRLSDIWQAEMNCLYEASIAGNCSLSTKSALISLPQYPNASSIAVCASCRTSTMRRWKTS